MVIKIAEYKIEKDKLETIAAAIKKFVTAVHEHEPNTFYAAYRRGNSLEFVHLMKFTDETAEKKHATATYTHEFVAVLYPNCEHEPKFTDLTIIE